MRIISTIPEAFCQDPSCSLCEIENNDICEIILGIRNADFVFLKQLEFDVKVKQ